ncbi:MAG: hypothetical protein EA377_08220, partial [Phycisphaerales bacterium]
MADDGHHIVIESKKWYFTYSTASGERKPMTGTEDYDATKRIASKLETEASEYFHGTRTARQDRFRNAAAKPLKTHIAEFERKMIAEGRTERHATSTSTMVSSIAELEGFHQIDQITADHVTHFAESLRREKRSPRTIHKYLTAIKSFTRWLVAEGKLIGDPLAGVKKPSPQRQRERRMLLPDEFHWLQEAARGHGLRYGLSGEERAMLYDFAIQTGLRAGEIRSLRCSQLYLHGEAPYVRVSAGATKNRQAAQQYLLRGLAQQLAEYIKTKLPSASVFDMPRERELPAMLREDLEAARAAWLTEVTGDPDEYRRREQSDLLLVTNHTGQVLDFHALRHTCGAWAASAGAHPKEVQTLMRHCSITLTMDTYGHLFLGQAATIVQRFAIYQPRVQELQMTGTDDSGSKWAANGQRANGTLQHTTANVDAAVQSPIRVETRRMQGIGTPRRTTAQQIKSGPVAELADAADLKSA